MKGLLKLKTASVETSSEGLFLSGIISKLKRNLSFPNNSQLTGLFALSVISSEVFSSIVDGISPVNSNFPLNKSSESATSRIWI